MRLSPLPFAAVLLATLAFSACLPAAGTPGDGGSPSQSSAASSTAGDISVTEPAPNATVASPLTVKGEARGTWYFEASFPVRLLDSNGNEITAAPAQAQGDWMTEDFVPFSVTLTFSVAPGTTGTLVLAKDNPSGDPAKAQNVRIPVKF
ncbi:MAG: Gmad2 immunoglobulin-like domain-containing protein [Candidatus Peribacter sp.]|nr:Gmad2 immunoglobulin-like domain-containing protein [Candidatus Peribacter sp.]